jgi:hypothetical protein
VEPAASCFFESQYRQSDARSDRSNLLPQTAAADDWLLLAAGRRRPARPRPLVQALDLVVTVTECLARCMSLTDVGVGWRLASAGDIRIELLFPEARDSLKPVPSSWPGV